MSRPNSIWFRRDTGWWMVTLSDQEIRLTVGRSNWKLAEQKFCKLKAIQALPSESGDARVVDIRRRVEAGHTRNRGHGILRADWHDPRPVISPCAVLGYRRRGQFAEIIDHIHYRGHCGHHQNPLGRARSNLTAHWPTATFNRCGPGCPDGRSTEGGVGMDQLIDYLKARRSALAAKATA